MDLNDLEKVHDLRSGLGYALQTLRAFERVEGDTVRSFATANHQTVVLLPILKEVAISAAKREVSKLIQQLSNLGVTVSEEQGARPPA